MSTLNTPTLRCRHCGAEMRHGRHATHDAGICLQPWYQQQLVRRAQRLPRLKPTRTRVIEPKDDLSPEQIERIMQRRAREQRWERRLAQEGA